MALCVGRISVVTRFQADGWGKCGNAMAGCNSLIAGGNGFGLPAHRFEFCSRELNGALVTNFDFSRRPSFTCAAGRRKKEANIDYLLPGESDLDLRRVLEFASDDELKELSEILYGSSLLSPVVKSLTLGDGSENESIDDVLFEGLEVGRQDARTVLLRRLEARFLFLAADSRLIFRQRRPTYRSVLLAVRAKLKVQCSPRLTVADLESEIFLHLLREYTESDDGFGLPGKQRRPENEHKKVGLGMFKGALSAALKMSRAEILETAIKGSGAVTASAIRNIALKSLSGKMFLETARYQVAREVLKEGGKAVASKLEAHVALLTARQGLTGAASRFAGFQSLSLLVGPILWGTFLADVAIRSVGTDYSRIIKAIFAIAQIRLTKTYGWTKE